MNEVIQTLTNHRSYLKYSDKPVSEAHIDQIISAAQAAPSWINGQQVTILSVQDEARKSKLATYSGNQKHVEEAPLFLVFCADFHRAKIAGEMEGTPFEAVHHTDVLLVGATDVGLAMGNAIAAAESLGLGIRPIGGLRKHPLEVIELLQLPEYVIPISGLCVGYPAEDPGLKPRLPQEAVHHREKYNPDMHSLIENYNREYEQYMMQQSGGSSRSNWTERVSGFYKDVHYSGNYKDVAKMLKQQGFVCKDMQEEGDA